MRLTGLEFTALVSQYQGLVYTVCHQMVQDPETAQDLAQETFLAAWRSIDRCPAGYEKQWLVRIATNKARDHLKSAWNRRMSVPGDEVLAFTLWGSGTLQKIVESSLTLPSRQEQMQPAPSAEQLWQTADNWLDDLLTRTELPAVWQNGTADPTEPTN